jgi:hypothetical protein
MVARLVASILIAIALPSSGWAQAAATRTPELSPTQAHAVIAESVRLIDSVYVAPERRQAITGKLQDAERAGRYATVDPVAFAGRVSDDVQAASGDKHLGLRWSPAEYAATSAAASAGRAHRAGAEYYARLGKRRNQGVKELRILPGNIRYMRYTNFLWEADVSGRALDDAMRFLRDGDALIIDLRGNGGGDASAVQYLISHFLSSPQLLMTFHDGPSGESSESRSLEYLPAGRISGKPLFVLIDRYTASAAEEFTYHVQQFKLGVLVGQTTAGAANNNALYPVKPGFMLSVSTGRPVHSVSGTNWEAAGIAPDVAVEPRQALNQAQVLALKQLSATAQDDESRSGYAWARVAVEARLDPRPVPVSELARYGGRYGDRTIRLEKGELIYSRPGRGDTPLEALTPELFAFGDRDNIRVHFIREGGRVAAMEVLYEDGRRERHDRAR